MQPVYLFILIFVGKGTFTTLFHRVVTISSNSRVWFVHIGSASYGSRCLERDSTERQQLHCAGWGSKKVVRWTVRGAWPALPNAAKRYPIRTRQTQ